MALVYYLTWKSCSWKLPQLTVASHSFTWLLLFYILLPHGPCSLSCHLLILHLAILCLLFYKCRWLRETALIGDHSAWVWLCYTIYRSAPAGAALTWYSTKWVSAHWRDTKQEIANLFLKKLWRSTCGEKGILPGTVLKHTVQENIKISKV